MNAARAAVVIVTTGFVSAGLPGCRTPAAVPASGERGELWNPFAPASMQVYPLTHLDRDDDGRARIVAHLDLRDAWGESVRGVGMLRILLYRRAEELSGRLDQQELAWDIDLNDLELNTSFYDRATRTYRVPLVGVPGWVEEMLVAEEEGRRLDRRLEDVDYKELSGRLMPRLVQALRPTAAALPSGAPDSAAVAEQPSVGPEEREII